jgi:hypothetical protein
LKGKELEFDGGDDIGKQGNCGSNMIRELELCEKVRRKGTNLRVKVAKPLLETQLERYWDGLN